ncbi:heparan-alpha-glucosaminide N-acetyltransferase domain-containing protein [Spirosoma fluminis]
MISAGTLDATKTTGELALRRVFSIDVFRALTMLLMIFVNDLWTLSGVPAWLEHAKADQDFLGFSDTIFPCFLFIVGMSIPFATRQRIAKGESRIQIARHIVVRSLALLVMGIFTVNVPDLNQQATGLSSEWFQILMVTGFFLIWNVYPKRTDSTKWIFSGLQLAGVILLVFLAIKFKGTGPDHTGPMTPQWWGILGLIGWTYLTCALLYVFAYKQPVLLVLSWVLFTLINIAGHAGWLHAIWPDGPRDWILGNGAFHAFAFAGILATLLLTRYNTQKLPVVYIGLGVLLILAGLISRNFFIISKIQATPTWVFLCSGIAFVVYAIAYYVVDLKDKANWFSLIRPAGTSTLTCYLIPYVYYSIADLSGVSLPQSLTVGVVGLLKSLLFALLVIGITAVLGKLRIRLKI